jgi:hypothetical protein
MGTPLPGGAPGRGARLAFGPRRAPRRGVLDLAIRAAQKGLSPRRYGEWPPEVRPPGELRSMLQIEAARIEEALPAAAWITR